MKNHLNPTASNPGPAGRWRVLAFIAGAILAGVSLSAQEEPAPEELLLPVRDPEAVRILAEVVDKLAKAQSLVVEFNEDKTGPETPFYRTGEITLMRPNFYAVEFVQGKKTLTRTPIVCSDGKNIWKVDTMNSIAYKQPARPESFYQGASLLVQYFFKPAIEFDPTDPTWGRSVSLFDTNKDAYNRSVSMKYLGETNLGDFEHVKIVEVKFNTEREMIKQVFYVQNNELLCVHTATPNGGYTLQLRNQRFDERFAPERFAVKLPKNIPLQEASPVELGDIAPDFELPLNTGEQVKLKELLKGKKGLLVVTLNGAAGRSQCRGPDYFLQQMRLAQTIRDKFQPQGLEVIAIVGGTEITPEVKEEMLLNWMPDQTRFSYPIALDLDLERGIQGSAYQNFQLNGRNNLLLDKNGRVVFASQNFDSNPINELALYQALASIDFAVSPADLELKTNKTKR